MEEDRIAQVAQVATRDRMDACLVEEEPAHGGGVDHRVGLAATEGRVIIGHTIAASKPNRHVCRRVLGTTPRSRRVG